jgi:hypothetical protein
MKYFAKNSENRILNVLSGVEANNVSVLNVSMLSTGKKLCHGYQNLAFEQNTCTLPERGCLVSLANELNQLYAKLTISSPVYILH